MAKPRVCDECGGEIEPSTRNFIRGLLRQRLTQIVCDRCVWTPAARGAAR